MSGGTITRCGDCGRLIIRGQRCICADVEHMDCDCTYSGNKQHIGPQCRQRIRDAWSVAVQWRRTA